MNKGFITISNELYMSEWSLVYGIFKDFIPTHIEFRHWENDTWYIYGVSKRFDKLQEAEKVPQYNVIISNPDGKEKLYIFDRVLSQN